MKAAYPGNNEENSVLDMLLERADIKGHLTMDDLEEIIPQSGSYPEKVDEVVDKLANQGINVVFSDKTTDSDEVEKMIPVETDMDPTVGFERVPSEDTISLYLREMSRVPLLNMEQEVDLAKRYEAGKAAREKLIKMNGNSTKKKRAELENIEQDGLKAREHLIKANTRLVVSVAKRYNGRGVPFLDLIQEGNLGLMKAVEKYDYRKGFRFSTYATWWIRQTITRAIADQGRTIRVPVHMVDRIRVMYKRTHELEQKLGREPTVEELAESLEIPKQKLEWMIRVSWLPLSLETPINEDEDESELGNFIEDQDTPTPSQSVYTKLLSEKIDEILESLPYREARILRLRFGLENGRFYTLEEVGKKFGLTRERIRQIETKALRRLRHPRRSRQLREYL
jgi:RNA polymerase primary sigma factor